MPNTTDTLVKKRLESVIANYSEEDVEKLRGTFNVEYTVSKNLSKKLWKLLNTEKYINTLGGLSGNHAVQHAKAGLKAIYLSGCVPTIHQAIRSDRPRQCAADVGWTANGSRSVAAARSRSSAGTTGASIPYGAAL